MKLAIVDLETTGANPLHHKVTEIAIVRVVDGQLQDQWHSLVDPETSIPAPIQALTGITDEMVQYSPRFADIAELVLTWLDGYVLVAHNARFDHGFLRNEFQRLNMPLKLPVLCTVKLSRRLFPEQAHHNLDIIIERHQLSCESRHRALGDALVLWQFIHKLYLEIDHQTLHETFQALLKKPNLPALVSEDVWDTLPEVAGVYIFHGDNDLPLYIGKSVNIRSRVLSHFTGDHQRKKDLQIATQLRHIEWIETAGELGALLLEARLVKEHNPLHNRQLRSHQTLYSWQWREEASSQSSPQLIDMMTLDASQWQHQYGLFKSKRQALQTLQDIVEEKQLCPKIVGLEKTTGSCFNFQIKKCNGACVGKEPLLQHQIRLMQALAPLKLKAWPFAGRIGIKETRTDISRTDIHVIENWCYIGCAQSQAEYVTLSQSQEPLIFDADIYKILTRYLNKSKKLEVI